MRDLCWRISLLKNENAKFSAFKADQEMMEETLMEAFVGTFVTFFFWIFN